MPLILKKGQRVNIYNRTVPTANHPEGTIFLEGEATLKRLINGDMSPELWEVEFDTEKGEVYQRFVFTQDIIKE